MTRARMLILIVAACGAEGSTDVQTSLFVERPYIEIAAGAPVAVGTPVMACAGSERTRAAPVSGLIPGGSFDERSTSHPTNVTIEATPASRVRVVPTPDGSCALLTPTSAGEIEVRFEGTIEGRESEASMSFRAVDAELRGEWVTTADPLLAGEQVEARVWAESGGTRVVTAAAGVALPPRVTTDVLGDLRLTLTFDATPGALGGVLDERRVLERAESVTSRLTDDPEGKALVVELHVGERALAVGEHEVTIHTPERCTTQSEAGPTDAPETTTHGGNIPLRARENAPEGACEMKIVTTYAEQRYEHEASVELGTLD